MKLSASHKAGLQALEEIAPQISLKVSALHNEKGVLNIHWDAMPGKYELQTSESLWPLRPVNHWLGCAEPEREADGPCPFNGHRAPFVRETLRRRV